MSNKKSLQEMNSRKRLKNISFYFSLFLIVCIVLFCILEIFLRIYPAPFVVKIKGNEIVLPRDKAKTWTYTHNNESDKYESGKIDKLVTVRQNNLGFRGADRPENISEYLTIMAVGGSTTYNAFISDGKTWTDVLGRKLQKVFNNVWINNAGFNGHSTKAHIYLMEQHITKLKPKILLLLVGLNETGEYDNIAILKGGTLSELRKKREFNRKTREFNTSLAKTKQRELEKLRIKTVKFRLINFFKNAGRKMSNYSEVVSLVISIYRNIKAYNLGLVYTSKLVNVLERTTIEISEEDRRTLENLLQSYNVKEDLIAYEARLKKLIKLSRDNNIEPVIITFPVLYGAGTDVNNINLAKVEIHPKYILDGEHTWKWNEMLNDVNRKVASNEGLLLIELSRKLPKLDKYYIDLIHYSNEGNEVVADIIFDSLCPYLAEHYSEYVMHACESN